MPPVLPGAVVAPVVGGSVGGVVAHDGLSQPQSVGVAVGGFVVRVGTGVVGGADVGGWVGVTVVGTGPGLS